jgi:hypothetical protein
MEVARAERRMRKAPGLKASPPPSPKAMRREPRRARAKPKTPRGRSLSFRKK